MASLISSLTGVSSWGRIRECYPRLSHCVCERCEIAKRETCSVLSRGVDFSSEPVPSLYKKLSRDSKSRKFTTTTISELKEMVEIQVGISPARQSLFFRGQELAGDATLRDLGVQVDSTLILTVGDPTPAPGHRFGGEGIRYNQDQHNSAANNSLQQYGCFFL